MPAIGGLEPGGMPQRPCNRLLLLAAPDKARNPAATAGGSGAGPHLGRRGTGQRGLPLCGTLLNHHLQCAAMNPLG